MILGFSSLDFNTSPIFLYVNTGWRRTPILLPKDINSFFVPSAGEQDGSMA